MWKPKHKARSRGKRLAHSLSIEAMGEVGRQPNRRYGYVVAEQLLDALNPSKAAGPVERLRDMSEEKRAEMERLYGPPSVRVLCPHCSWGARAADPVAKLARHMRWAHQQDEKGAKR